MEHLPPAGWSHLASKDDVALSGALLRTELAEVRTEIADLRTELKTEIADLRTELKTDIAELRIDLEKLRADVKTDVESVSTEVAILRGDLVGEMEKGFRTQTWKMVSAIGASQAFTVSMVGLMLHYVR
jgi:hypothetical protein